MTDSGKLRLFFAFEVRDGVRSLAVDHIDHMRNRIGTREVRWACPDDLHITTFFLGDHENVRLHAFVAAGEQAAFEAEPFDFRVGGLGCFPASVQPRVLWLGASEPAARPASTLLAHLQSLLPDVPLDHAIYRPHITLGYVRPTANRTAVQAALESSPPSVAIEMTVDRLVLMQTIPEDERRKSGSARYNTVQVFPFSM